MERIWRVLFHRVTVIVLLILVQIAALVFAVLKFDEDFVYFYGFCFALSIVAVLCIINNKSNPAYKIAWIIPILALPIFGGMFYLFFNGDKLWFRRKKRMEEINRDFIAGMDLNNGVLEEIASQDSKAGNQSRYIEKFAQCPPYRNTVTEYLPSGEVKFKFLLEELRKAKRYIFLEYFIIEEGKMWNSVLHILQEKAKRGVEVRVIYDDMGSLMTLPANYKAKLEDLGIKCCVFNPFIPVLSLQFNNRDHRKICVIDGVAGFMGGINLADEYINARKKHGHWKDTAILLKGDAVWSLVVMFLSMWGYVNKTREDYGKFRPREIPDLPPEQSAGYVQPYTDSPLDDESVGETVYLNLINKAERYVYINTPYLILSNEMITALSAAAKGGVDVRIVTPHIGDKWFVHSVTRAYYGPLVEAGVKIYEYTPGFIHAKSFVVDGEYGVVGSINLDYRSLYLHFESAVWLYRTNSIVQILEDYQKCLELCEEVTLQDVRGVKWYRRLTRSVLRVFAPLM